MATGAAHTTASTTPPPAAARAADALTPQVDAARLPASLDADVPPQADGARLPASLNADVPPARPAVWVVLVDYNGVADTRDCLRSLGKCRPAAPVVVVDNAGRLPVADQLAGEFPGVAFVRSPVNGGWAGGNNLGLAFAFARGADAVVLLNNDTTVRPDFVDRMTCAAAAHPGFGILGPVIRFMDPPCEVQTDGVRFNRPGAPGFFQRHPVALADHSPPQIEEVDIVNGCCLMVRREVYDRVGPVDEGYFLVHEESDFCLRSQAAGFKNGVIAEALVWHKGSSSFRREGKRLQRYFDARNLARLLRRHHRRACGRGLPASVWHHLRYSFHRYAIERDGGYPDSAEAVIEGLYDAAAGRWGPHSVRPRPGLALLRLLFRSAHRFSPRPRPTPPA